MRIVRHFSIRRLAGRRDLAGVGTIDGHCLAPLPGWGPRDFQEFLTQPGHNGFVATWDGTVAGYLLYRISLPARRVDITRLGVDPGFRRSGLATRLVDRVKRAPAARGLEILVLVHEGQLPVQLFWRANGFQAIRICRQVYGPDGADGYLFSYLPQQPGTPG